MFQAQASPRTSPEKSVFKCSKSQDICERHGVARAMQREEGKPRYVEEKLLCIPISRFFFCFSCFFWGGLCGDLYQPRVIKIVADHAGGIGCALLTVHQMGPVIGWPI